MVLRDPLRWRGPLARGLLDHVRLAGERYAWKDLALRRPVLGWKPLPLDGSFGYQTATRAPFSDLPSYWERLERTVVGGLDSDEATRSLTRAIELAQELGGQVVVAEGAPHPGAHSRLARAGASAASVREVLTAAVAQTGASLLLLDAEPAFPESLFRDSKHLNEEGAALYSDWLGRSLPLEGPGPPG